MWNYQICWVIVQRYEGDLDERREQAGWRFESEAPDATKVQRAGTLKETGVNTVDVKLKVTVTL